MRYYLSVRVADEDREIGVHPLEFWNRADVVEVRVSEKDCREVEFLFLELCAYVRRIGSRIDDNRLAVFAQDRAVYLKGSDFEGFAVHGVFSFFAMLATALRAVAKARVKL